MQESIRDVLRLHLLETKAENYINKFPPNTKIHTDGIVWSMWDGYLALVTGPSYSSYSYASNVEFDSLHMARRYCIRYALTLDRKKKVKPERSDIGFEPHIDNPRAEYTKTTWSMGTPGYGPLRQGTFDDVFCVWVKLKMNELWPGETQLVISGLDKDGYYDATDARYNIKQNDWKKLLKMSFADTQNQDAKLANAVDELITAVLGRHAKDEKEEEKVWADVGGIYKATKKRDRIMWIVPK